MKPGIFKSATALAVVVSLAAPLPALSQDKGNKRIDLTGMTNAEIGELVERCRNRAERRQKELAAGEEVQDKKGRIAKFCKAYATGAFDAGLPGELQSASVLASVAEMTAGTEAEAETAGTETGVEAGAETEASAEAEAAADTATAQEADEPAALAEALEQQTEAQAAAQNEQAEADQPAGATAAVPAQSQGEASDETDNPELVELDSQAQADAQAAAETGTPAAAAAAAENTAGKAEVIEETVTEDTVRSSDEEFETDAGENAQAAAEAPDPQTNTAPKQDDGGLSNQQRNALLGLGALAIGTLLNNGGKVVSNTGDRAIVEQDGQYRVLKDDDALLRQPGSNVTAYRFQDGSTRTVVIRDNGVEVETIRSAEGRVLRRTRILPDGRSVVLFDDTRKAEKVDVNELPQFQDNRRAFSSTGAVSAEDLAAALAAQQAPDAGRSFSLAQIRNIDAVRRLVPVINVDSVNFDTGSAVIRTHQAEELASLGNALRELVDRNPGEVFLIEGHTDAVGAATYNLALSDRRAETVALALTEYFGVPPENMVVQGYGESDLTVRTLAAERANRRVAVRRITPLLGSEADR
ncbi:OmpA family protein [Leisingera sp.]|uniref:OmpA family protein n=1 Tax=Leisingera sp. TaxID=1879318 RepID=UPI002B277520|nr:OmpA family protein [Leisingera sp.]